MLIPDVHGSAPGGLERLLAVVAQEGALVGIFLHRLTCVHAIHMGTHLFLIRKFLLSLRADVHPRHLSILVAVPHVPLQACIQFVRDATFRAGKGCLRRVCNDNLTLRCCCCCCCRVRRWLLLTRRSSSRACIFTRVLQASDAGF